MREKIIGDLRRACCDQDWRDVGLTQDEVLDALAAAQRSVAAGLAGCSWALNFKSVDPQGTVHFELVGDIPLAVKRRFREAIESECLELIVRKRMERCRGS